MNEEKKAVICGLTIGALFALPLLALLFTGCAHRRPAYKCNTEPAAVEHESAGGKPLRGLYFCFEDGGGIHWEGGSVPAGSR